jgi:hypothetical protein
VKTNKIALFIVHYSKLRERRVQLEKSLLNCEIPVHWITEEDLSLPAFRFIHDYNAFDINPRLIALDRSNNSRSLVKPRIVARLEGYLLFVRSYLFPGGITYLTDNPKPKVEDSRLLELSQMHLECLKLARDLDLDWALVIEDDAIIDWQGLNPVLKEVNQFGREKPIWCNLSSGAGLSRTKFDPSPNKLGLFRVRPWASRCASGYLINRKFYSKAIDNVSEYGVPDWTAIDVVYQILMRKLRATVFWQEPPSIHQGSETGEYESNWIH